MTEIIFKYSHRKEYTNFKNTSTSINCSEPTPVFQTYLKKFKVFNEKNVVFFVKDYLRENKIEVKEVKSEIVDRWHKVSQQFFIQADKIFGRSLPAKKVTAYLTIDHRCSYNFKKNYFFVRLDSKQTNRIIMHELWHWYFWHNGGREIMEKYGYLIFNDIKESLTVLLNVEFVDLLNGAIDKGYSQHQLLRKKILNKYKQVKNIYKVIDYCIEELNKK